MLDDYGYTERHDGWRFTISIRQICKLLRWLWGPSKSDIDKKLKKARKDKAEWEAMFAKPTRESDKS